MGIGEQLTRKMLRSREPLQDWPVSIGSTEGADTSRCLVAQPLRQVALHELPALRPALLKRQLRGRVLLAVLRRMDEG